MATAAEKRARQIMAKMLSIPEPDHVFEDRGYHPFVIGNGPSEPAFIDSLKLYPGSQKISVFFGYISWGSPNFEGALWVTRDKTRSRRGLPNVEAQIIAACRLNNGNGWDRDRWGFIARVVDGEWKDQFIVGLYRTEARQGFFDIVKE